MVERVSLNRCTITADLGDVNKRERDGEDRATMIFRATPSRGCQHCEIGVTIEDA